MASEILLVIATKRKAEGIFARPPFVLMNFAKKYYLYKGIYDSKIYYYISCYIAVTSVVLC